METVKVPVGYVVGERRVNVASLVARQGRCVSCGPGNASRIVLFFPGVDKEEHIQHVNSYTRVPVTMLTPSSEDAASGTTGAPGEPQPPPA